MPSFPDLTRRPAPASAAGRVPTATSDGVLRRALADAAPISLGYVPYGLVLGATIAASPLPRGVTWAATPLLFAGASQLALIDLLEVGAAPVVVIATALVVNLRLVMYSGAIAPWFRSTGRGTRLAAAALVIDPVYTMAAVRFPYLPTEAARRRYWFALGLVLWTVWQVEVTLGVLIGSTLPESVPLDLAAPLTFLAMLVPNLADRPALVSAATAGVTALLAHDVPIHLGLLFGALAGVTAGTLAARRGSRPT